MNYNLTKRLAKKRSWICGNCNGVIPQGSKYYDSDAGSGIGLWNTIKFCSQCAGELMRKGEAGLIIKTIRIRR
ncbi:MAG: hypothetical protein FJ150_02795 [Euryarchaeota archaeon]|nr:hypothetical protein [Euryarchaeota archaeon]